VGRWGSLTKVFGRGGDGCPRKGQFKLERKVTDTKRDKKRGRGREELRVIQVTFRSQDSCESFRIRRARGRSKADGPQRMIPPENEGRPEKSAPLISRGLMDPIRRVSYRTTLAAAGKGNERRFLFFLEGGW